jgi:hypothetical protein
MKIRVFITTGDELQLSNICDKFNCKLEIGGPPNEHDLTLQGFERPIKDHAGSKGGGRTDWMVVYLIVDILGQAFGIRSHFNHIIKNYEN